MAKEKGGGLLAAAFEAPPKEARTSGKKTGEKKGKAEGATQVGERAMSKGKKAEAPKKEHMAMSPMPYKPPSVSERLVEDAKHSKVNATRNWVEGRMSTEDHNEVHGRADHVIRHGKMRPEGAKLGAKPAKIKEKRNGFL